MEKSFCIVIKHYVHIAHPYPLIYNPNIYSSKSSDSHVRPEGALPLTA